MRRDGGIAGMSAGRQTGQITARRLAPVLIIVLLAVLVFAMGWHRQLSLETLVRHRAALHDFVDAHYAVALAIFVAAYVTAVSLSIPGAVFLTIAGGLLFGVLAGAAAVVVG